MKIVGLTGGISTGKSTVSRFLLEERNDWKARIAIVDADVIARDIVAPGLPSYRRIVKEFGPDVVDPETKQLRRDRLGAIVFADQAARRKLNSFTHPYVRLEMLRQLLWHFLRGEQVVFLDTPLLFESKIDKWVHRTAVVYCPREVQKERLMRRDNLDDEKALQRIDAQIPIDEKRDRADIVIDNSGSLSNTKLQVAEML
ncbi:dephospho-CoA kinase, partial [Cladochytrium replicatum]